MPRGAVLLCNALVAFRAAWRHPWPYESAGPSTARRRLWQPRDDPHASCCHHPPCLTFLVTMTRLHPARHAGRQLAAVAFAFAVLALVLALWALRAARRSTANAPKGAGAAPPPSSTYLARGVAQPKLDLSRNEMIALYEEDVRRSPWRCRHVRLDEQNPALTGVARIRVLRWNINGLMGTR